MNKSLSRALAGWLALLAVAIGCTKIDTTNLGTDLIPEVDNIHTFADTLDIITTQGIFSTEDTAKIYLTESHILGRIDNDPDFGTTNAELFLEVKPSKFPFYFGSEGDTIVGIDSVVLCLSYRGFYGDSTIPQQLQAFAVDNILADDIWTDSFYRMKPVTYAPTLKPAPISPVTPVDIRELNEYKLISTGFDSVVNQIRIKLDMSSDFVTTFLSQDSSESAVNNGFHNDSLFRELFRGFGIRSNSGNAIMYTDLLDGLTRLEVHYRSTNDNVLDTGFTSLTAHQYEVNNILPTSSANLVVRDRSTGTYPPTGLPVDELYLQTTPGTFAMLQIPELTDYPKRVIHRAQIMIEQVPSATWFYDSIFNPPGYLYVDLKDTGTNNYFKPVYEDLNPNAYYNPDFNEGAGVPIFPNQMDFNYFGGVRRSHFDPVSGRNTSYYVINLSRYVQKISKAEVPNHTLRLFAPYSFTYPQHHNLIINYNNPLAFGRVKVGGGGNPNYKMRMVIIYSRI